MINDINVDHIKNTELTSQKIAVEMTKLPMQACEGRRGFGISVFRG